MTDSRKNRKPRRRVVLLVAAGLLVVAASTVKLLVLAGYAEAVVGGALDPNEQVPVSAWQAYYLPHTDGGAHQQGLALVSYAQPKQGPLAGEIRVVVVVANGVPPGLWQRALLLQSIYLVQAEIAQATGEF